MELEGDEVSEMVATAANSLNKLSGLMLRLKSERYWSDVESRIIIAPTGYNVSV
jgi:hypothetical protein